MDKLCPEHWKDIFFQLKMKIVFVDDAKMWLLFFLCRLSELGSITCCYLNPHILKRWKMTFWTKKVKSNKQKFSLSFFLYNFCYFLCYLVKLGSCMYNNATSGTLELCTCRHGTYKYLYLLVLPSMKKRLSCIVRLVNGKSLG